MKNFILSACSFFGLRIAKDCLEVHFDEKKFGKFAKIFDEKIQPLAKKAEEERIKAIGKIFISVVFIAIPALFFLLMIEFSDNHFSFWERRHYRNIAGALLTFGGYCAWRSWLDYKNQMKNSVFKELFKLLNFFYLSGGFSSSGDLLDFGRKKDEFYNEFGIFPCYDFYQSEDLIQGKREEVFFSFEEITLFRKGASYDKIIFQGAVILCGFNKVFQGKTLLCESGGDLVSFAKNRLNRAYYLQPVKLENAGYERMFEVYSSSQAEANILLNLEVLERLERLQKFFQTSKIRAAFSDNQMILAFDKSAQMFEPKSIFKSFNPQQEGEKILEQRNLIFSLIDSLNS